MFRPGKEQHLVSELTPRVAAPVGYPPAWRPVQQMSKHAIMDEPMKIRVAVLMLAAALSSPAVAQSQTSCQSIAKATDRLACYDRATPPVAAPKQAAKSKPGAKNPPDQAQIVDQLAVENSRLSARLKTICRGC